MTMTKPSFDRSFKNERDVLFLLSQKGTVFLLCLLDDHLSVKPKPKKNSSYVDEDELTLDLLRTLSTMDSRR